MRSMDLGGRPWPAAAGLVADKSGSLFLWPRLLPAAADSYGVGVTFIPPLD